jgi:hypothetical protein
MRASRLLTSWLIAALLVMGGVEPPPPAVGTAHAQAAESPSHIGAGDGLIGSEAFQAAPPVAPVAGLEQGGRSPAPTFRVHRLARLETPPRAQAARIAALSLSRLSYAHALDSARFGWFIFGSTAPPPSRG